MKTFKIKTSYRCKYQSKNLTVVFSLVKPCITLNDKTAQELHWYLPRCSISFDPHLQLDQNYVFNAAYIKNTSTTDKPFILTRRTSERTLQDVTLNKKLLFFSLQSYQKAFDDVKCINTGQTEFNCRIVQKTASQTSLKEIE